MTSRLTVLYDADCGLCSVSASVLRRLDSDGGRNRRLSLVPLQVAKLDPETTLTEADLTQSLRVRAPDGAWHAGGEAVLRIAEALPALRPLAFLGRLPALRPLVEPTYRLVARNRHRISAALGALFRISRCASPR